MAEDRSQDLSRRPEIEEEPLRHVSIEDFMAAKAHNEEYQEGHRKFDRGEIKTANERL
jgi:hypothetical protein